MGKSNIKIILPLLVLKYPKIVCEMDLIVMVIVRYSCNTETETKENQVNMVYNIG